MSDATLATDANSKEISTALQYFSCYYMTFKTDKDAFSWEVENIRWVDL